MIADPCNLHSIAYNTYVEQIFVPSKAFFFSHNMRVPHLAGIF